VSPLFAGYIFARFDAAVLLGKVRYTRGIRNVVGFGEYATPVEDEVMELIQSRTDADGFVHVVELRPGDAVEVVDGPMRSLSGVFERHLSQEDRVLILLTTVRSQIRVELSKACIRSLTPCTVG
jgi:transcription antitermination factor NusG